MRSRGGGRHLRISSTVGVCADDAYRRDTVRHEEGLFVSALLDAFGSSSRGNLLAVHAANVEERELTGACSWV